jgi:predicted AlkP superfamily phosphohydrolase/phosphomutase/tetratricopeptide (TPR) repeat protein
MANSKITSAKRPLLLLGWDGAEWDVIDSLCERGEMPHLSQLRNFGFEAKLASLQPMLSPLLWTSVVTGKRAHEHGVLGFVEEGLSGIRPVSSKQRKVPALWNILSEAGLRCQVLNWWPSNPPEKIKGPFVSNLAFADGLSDHQAYPASWGDIIQGLKEAFPEADTAILEGFIPQIEQQDPKLLQALGQILKRSKWQFELAMKMLTEEADCRFFYFEALDQIQHLATKYFPATSAEGNIPEIIRAAYRWHDAMLGSILNRAANHNVILLSDHGFNSSAEKPHDLPDVPAAPAAEHNPFGIFIAAGPDVNPEASLYGLSLLDICPSILHYFSLPLGRDMSGRSLNGLFKERGPASSIPTWDGLVAVDFSAAPEQLSAELLKDLEELEYIDLSKGAPQLFIREEQAYNAAVSLKEAGDYSEALNLANQYWQASPQAYRWYILKGRLHLALKDGQGFKDFWQSLSTEQQAFGQLRFFKAIHLLQEGQSEAALKEMKSLAAAGFKSAALFSEMGHALFLAAQYSAADTYFNQALSLNANYSSAWNGRAQVAFAQGDFEKFQSFANRALELKIFQPQLHYLWAQYYIENGDPTSAAKALAACLQMAPKHLKARQLKEQMEDHSSSEYTYIVSGFPRSGTSLMMSLLQAAGLEVLEDHQRQADEHNPRGYHELEAVKKLPLGGGLPKSEGKALKVVAPLLNYLPADRRYKLLWMDRPLLELILSQAKMRGEEASLTNFPFQKGQQLEAEQKRIQQWLDLQPHIEWITVSYPKLCAGVDATLLAELSAFLGIDINADMLQARVDPQLHRNKIG